MPVRYRLFRKYAAVLMGLVGGALVIEGLFEMAFTYRESLQAAAQVQRAEVSAAAGRIEQYLAAIERQVVQVSGLPWSSGLLQMSERRDEYHRAMKYAPAISEVRDVGPDGRERLRASRSELDEIDSGRDLSGSSIFQHAREHAAYYSPAFFREGSVPYLTLAVRDAGGRGDVTLAELNLKFVGDVVSQITIGRRGRVYAVDSENHLVAHPDLGLVLRRPDLSSYGALQHLRDELRRSGEQVVGMFPGRGLEGTEMMLSAALIPSTQWLVVAEQPRAEVLEPLYQSLFRTLWVMGARRTRRARGELPARPPAGAPDPRAARGSGEARGRRPHRAHPHLHRRRDRVARQRVEPHGRPAAGLHHGTRAQGRGEDGAARDGQPPQERVPRQHVARAAHAAERHHRLLRGAARSSMFGELNDKQGEYVRDIYASGQHLLSLINDILDLSKVEAGRMELDLHDFSVRAAIDNCCTLIRERAQRKRLQLDSHVFEDVGDVASPTSASSSRSC